MTVTLVPIPKRTFSSRNEFHTGKTGKAPDLMKEQKNAVDGKDGNFEMRCRDKKNVIIPWGIEMIGLGRVALKVVLYKLH